MPGSPHRMARRALVALALAGCSADSDGELLAPIDPAPAVGLAVSSLNAAPGARIVVAVRPASRGVGPIAGLQGSLQFDPDRLEYLGQSPGGTGVLVTNWDATDRGDLRLLAIDTLLRRVEPAVFGFRVKAGGYAERLRFRSEGAVGAGGRPMPRVETQAGVAEDPTLELTGEPRRLTVEDWAERMGRPRASVRVALSAGQGTRYGDATLDGQVNILDALATANVAVGNAPLLTDAARDFAVAANVHPANLPGLGEAGDPLLPGREPDGTFVINVLDVSVITNESIGNDPPVAGELIPGRTAPAARAVLAGSIAANRTLSRDTVYELDGLVTVPNFVTLTIPAGTRLEGRTTSRGALAILLGGRILARGTRLEPIVMTCTAAEKSPGCWGGLTIAGPALLNNGDAGSGNEVQCPEKQASGGAGTYGGCLVEFSSGTLRYVRIEYAGMPPTGAAATAGLQLLGVGSGTELDSVQVHRGLGAGVFVSGGRARAPRGGPHRERRRRAGLGRRVAGEGPELDRAARARRRAGIAGIERARSTRRRPALAATALQRDDRRPGRRRRGGAARERHGGGACQRRGDGFGRQRPGCGRSCHLRAPERGALHRAQRLLGQCPRLRCRCRLRG